ncbi:MAG: universal stress protein [Alphaproteobacteria bacterium]|jgi:nucleotide-binding universal stress UspA family protein|nr:universal stress protein [Alphaproteobacteria bacterium]
MTKAEKKSSVKIEPVRVFLVVVDDSEELHQALYYACRRAKRLKGKIALMHCILPAEFQHFAGVGELMREEAREEAEKLLRVNSEWVHELTGEYPMIYLREGDPKSELISLINEEEDISILILGADTNSESTGPLITYMTTKGASQCRVPITIVPGNLSDENIDRLT